MIIRGPPLSASCIFLCLCPMLFPSHFPCCCHPYSHCNSFTQDVELNEQSAISSMTEKVVEDKERCLHLWAVHVKPPVTDEVLLVEERAVGAEEAVLEQGVAAVRGADVEWLTVGICVRVVPAHHDNDHDDNDDNDGLTLQSVRCSRKMFLVGWRIWGSPLQARRGCSGLQQTRWQSSDVTEDDEDDECVRRVTAVWGQ